MALLFEGKKPSDFSLQVTAGSITEVADPAGSGEKVMALTVTNTSPSDEEGNVLRAQAYVPTAYWKLTGADLWTRFGFYVPSSFQEVTTGWMTLEAVYGPPYSGASAIQLALEPLGNLGAGEWFMVRRNGNYSYDAPWAKRLVRNHWYDILIHEEFAAAGHYELWVDGVPIKFFSSDSFYNPLAEPATYRLSVAMLDSTNNEADNQAKIMQYRSKEGMPKTGESFTPQTLNYKDVRIGTARADVEAALPTMSGYAPTVTEDAPLAWWRMGEASGTVAADSSGHAHPGEYTNAPTLAQPGAIASEPTNTAVKFNGTNQRVVIPNFTGPGDTFTIEAWVKLTVAEQSGVILHLGVGAASFRLNAGKLQLLAASTAELRITTAAVPFDGKSHHCVVTKTGTTIKIYVDGVSQTLSGSSTTACVNNTEQSYGIGAYGIGAGGEWNSSTLDEVALYGTALSEARVKAHFEAAAEAVVVPHNLGLLGVGA